LQLSDRTLRRKYRTAVRADGIQHAAGRRSTIASKRVEACTRSCVIMLRAFLSIALLRTSGDPRGRRSQVQILRLKTPGQRVLGVHSVLKPGIEVAKLGKDRKDNIISAKSPRCCSAWPSSCCAVASERGVLFLIFRRIAAGCVPPLMEKHCF